MESVIVNPVISVDTSGMQGEIKTLSQPELADWLRYGKGFLGGDCRDRCMNKNGE